MFREILAAINSHQPREILVDFEQGAINAIDAVFPNANIWKNIQRHGLQVQYGANEELRDGEAGRRGVRSHKVTFTLDLRG